MPEPNRNSAWARGMIDEFIRNGVDIFCISPGSRNTPLVMALAENPAAKSLIHFDERGAAFHALGCAKALGLAGKAKPVVLVCTSGTAAANYFPAIIEASTSCVPLVVLTADRPPELLDAGANQAIDQSRLYGDYARWQITLPCPDEAVPQEAILTAVNQAIHRSLQCPAGPVHINCMYREPLEPAAAEGAPHSSQARPYTEYVPTPRQMDSQSAASLVERIKKAERGLLVVGQLRSRREMQSAQKLAEKLHWPVVADCGSGLRLGTASPPFVHYYDQMLLSAGVQDYLRPDVVVQLGTPVVSKRLQQHLAAYPPNEFVLVADHPFRHDPAHRVTCRVAMDVGDFCESVMGHVTPTSPGPWLARLCADSLCVHNTVQEFLESQEGLCEPAVARVVSDQVPENSAIFLGKSMPIRDFDMNA